MHLGWKEITHLRYVFGCTPLVQSDQSSSRASSESPPLRAARLFCCLRRHTWSVWTEPMRFPRERPLLEVRSELGVVALCLW
jgi:hypothetical protein